MDIDLNRRQRSLQRGKDQGAKNAGRETGGDRLAVATGAQEELGLLRTRSDTWSRQSLKLSFSAGFRAFRLSTINKQPPRGGGADVPNSASVASERKRMMCGCATLLRVPGSAREMGAPGGQSVPC